MKLNKFSIRGFRSLKDVSWKPGDLNVLIGPNGSGKSNLLRALELLQEAATGSLDAAIVQGGIRSLVWDRQTREIGWSVSVDAGANAPFLGHVKDLRYELCLLSLGSAAYRIERESLADYTKTAEETGAGKYNFQRFPKEAIFFSQNGEKIEVVSDRFQQIQTVLSEASGSLSSPHLFWFRLYLRSWKIYDNLTVQQNSAVRKPAITQQVDWLSPTGENLISALYTLYNTIRTFKVQLNDAMRAAFGKDFEELEFPPAEDQHIQMRVRWKSLQNADSAADLSEGTLKFLMLITILANPMRGDLVAIDEPETYLHPSMFPIVAELAAEASKRSQIIFTTHSPEFLTAIGPYHPSTAVLQNVEGETKLNVLDQQEMKRWLEKYKLGELFISGDLEALV